MPMPQLLTHVPGGAWLHRGWLWAKGREMRREDALIYGALCKASLFLAEVPEAGVFERSALGLPTGERPLNFNQKLGHLYEQALAHLIDASARYDLLEQGLQLQRDKAQTVGELDYLIRDLESGRLVQLELAVKFYLAVESDQGVLLPGPDARDNYGNKLCRLRTHQLTLAQRYRRLLPAAYQTEEIDSQHLVIGCLFDHYHASRPAQADHLSPTVRRGRWIHQSDFCEVVASDDEPYAIPKPYWPVPDVPRDLCIPLDLSVPLSRCVMVQLQSEHDPLFIAPDGYPIQR